MLLASLLGTKLLGAPGIATRSKDATHHPVKPGNRIGSRLADRSAGPDPGGAGLKWEKRRAWSPPKRRRLEENDFLAPSMQQASSFSRGPGTSSPTSSPFEG